jgi:hypothetical protein
VAQLGARFHGMEEVNGSNPFRSTKFLKYLPHAFLQTPTRWSPNPNSRRLYGIAFILSIGSNEFCKIGRLCNITFFRAGILQKALL